MSKIQLSASFSANPMTRPIIDHEVEPAGIEWAISAIHPSEMFWRQLHFADFDISEMSLASLLISWERGGRDWIPLPIFTTRRFFHTGIVVGASSDIVRPQDLVGRRVGVPEYQQTAAVWSRAALQHEFGVRPSDLVWFMERRTDLSHGGATAFRPPSGIDLTYIPDGQTIADLLAAGELDSSLVYLTGSNLVDRAAAGHSREAQVRTLFPDPIAEGVRYYRSTGIVPVNHCVVVRRTVVETYPWVLLNVFAAFQRAKTKALRKFHASFAPYEQLGLLPSDVMDDVRTADPFPYGLAQQRLTLEALSAHLLEQGLVERSIAVEELFPERTLAL